ncbi:MAG: hydroxyacylglutathione hydrolase [Myxococcales bacterium]|nr:hydroxyacylglutathione hydrolase [Myxococcales bacterium]
MHDAPPITIVPCLSDNYSYVVRCAATGATLLVDPSEPEPVLAAIEAMGGRLDAVLCTHHHPDHVGGLDALRERFSSLRVYAHHEDESRIDGVTHALGHDDGFYVGSMAVRALHVPAHTSGALSYVLDERAVFTGDTLFSAGCGRLFEGTPAMMNHALNDVLGALADTVLVYPGHEYAEKNLRFALEVEPGSDAIRARQARVASLREKNAPAVPSTLGEERETNPFLRVKTPTVQRFARAKKADVAPEDPASVLAVVRAARDRF